MFIIVLLLSLQTTLFAQNYYADAGTQIFDPSVIEHLDLTVNQASVEVELRETRSSRVIIRTMVHIDVNNQNLVDFLLESGRYKMIDILHKEQKRLLLSSPGLEKELIFKGKKLDEKIKYIVYLPKGVQFEEKVLI